MHLHLETARQQRRRIVTRFRFALLAIVLLAGACGERINPASSVLVQSAITPAPPHVGPASVQVTLTDPAGTPLSGLHVSMEADMSHAGMAPIFFDSQETEKGHYKGDVNFSMPGDWVILLHITMTDGSKIEKQFEVPGVLAN
jgi:hypothetical protein